MSSVVIGSYTWLRSSYIFSRLVLRSKNQIDFLFRYGRWYNSTP
ncbi:hypothetical protein LEP1GSC132_3623 [Leptospira kirschneri str. 200803703]|uniref:Uncharacterized protein n=1 Tax=Leptospira kirschneri str. 200802841 TaxID=1193047 RepID=A0A828Y832_9LEPT|nr:hypothetical protein LEP1GSC044_4063 [Leptospira kirschneri serovar Grippotyphosa str. RM52]EKO51602.1 hypothetical protein LEP1GSC131_1701 [Leptospira kirschneri str. 200802841]EKP06837.1 hypothetical protein LEP1GSC018_0316 [Leptospira kirschneri str. 2008720114]EKQ85285.1 hypothetical protein LEP1GSC064_3453 [Leptospira kirschneri serovar Grippotyphosa str. Moskva]EKR06464.1 hypothetical protein LEP1GSC122_0419 [Leptospira kirschneri serovar Valbuzzi str. 200702274]EMK00252.1 hypothetica